MADKKYSAGAISVSKEQLEVIDAAMEKFFELNGVRLSRSQTLTMLANWYVKAAG